MYDSDIWIEAPGPSGFTAGVCIHDGYVVRAAPVLAYMIGWPEPKVREYAQKRGWTCYPPDNEETAYLSKAVSGLA